MGGSPVTSTDTLGLDSNDVALRTKTELNLISFVFSRYSKQYNTVNFGWLSHLDLTYPLVIDAYSINTSFSKQASISGWNEKGFKYLTLSVPSKGFLDYRKNAYSYIGIAFGNKMGIQAAIDEASGIFANECILAKDFGYYALRDDSYKNLINNFIQSEDADITTGNRAGGFDDYLSDIIYNALFYIEANLALACAHHQDQNNFDIESEILIETETPNFMELGQSLHSGQTSRAQVKEILKEHLRSYYMSEFNRIKQTYSAIGSYEIILEKLFEIKLPNTFGKLEKLQQDIFKK